MRVSSALCALPALAIIIAGLGSIPTAASTADELSLRSKVAFVPSEVTINGAPRPDIGRALADSFSAAALKRGRLRVFNIDVPAAPVRVGKGRKNLAALGSNAATAAATAGTVAAVTPRDLDFLYSFTLVGEGEAYALTLKKVRAENNEIVEAHEMKTQGRLDRIFAMVPLALDKIDARLYPPAFPRTQSPAEIRAAQPVVASASSSSWGVCRPGTWSGIPPEYVDVDLSTVPKALTYQRLGSIAMANDPWRFAIINPVSGARIGRREHLDVQWDDGGPGVYSRLRVSGFDSGKVIADYGTNPSYHRLYPGDSVYGWAPPMQ